MTTTSDPTTAQEAPPTSPRGRWIDDWRPEDSDHWENGGRPDRPAEPRLVDLRRAPRLLGLADLERLVGVPAGAGLRVHPAAAVPPGRAAQPGRVAAAAALHVRGAEVRRPQLDDRERRAAADPDAAVRGRGAEPGDALLGVLPDRRHGGLRRRQLRQLDGQHQLLLPRRQEGHRARAQRRRRQPRRLPDPAAAAGDRRRRRHLRPGQGRPRAASTSSARRTCTPASRSSRCSRRTSSWTTSRPPSSKPREQLRVLRQRQTWVMAFLYVGTFGSFIGYSAAMPLLIKLNFWVPEPAPLGPGSSSPTTPSWAPASAPRPALRRLAGRPLRRRQGHAGRVRAR